MDHLAGFDQMQGQHRWVKSTLSFQEMLIFLELANKNFLILSFENGGESKESRSKGRKSDMGKAVFGQKDKSWQQMWTSATKLTKTKFKGWKWQLTKLKGCDLYLAFIYNKWIPTQYLKYVCKYACVMCIYAYTYTHYYHVQLYRVLLSRDSPCWHVAITSY